MRASFRFVARSSGENCGLGNSGLAIDFIINAGGICSFLGGDAAT